MPWKASDAKRHNKDADTPKKQRQWAAVANSALQACLEDGGNEETCAASAIKQADSVVAKEVELGEVAIHFTGGLVDPAAIPIVGEAGRGDEHFAAAANASGRTSLENGEVVQFQGEDALTAIIHHFGLNIVQEDMLKQWLKNPDSALVERVYIRDSAHQDNSALNATRTSKDMKETGLQAKARAAQDALNAKFRKDREPAVAYETELWAEEVFEDDELMGNAVIVMDKGERWAVPYTKKGSEYEFLDRSEWRRVRQRWEYAEVEMEEFAEAASGRAMRLVEADGRSVVPLHIEVVLIEPGFGNKKDNHYYPRNVLERDAKVFSNAKMYESDHGNDKSTRLWVSTIKEIKGFTESGAPIGLVSVHDPNFATRILALEADGLLGRMECSILANGTARKGKVDGRTVKIVEGITEASSVDWVTRAGAGGRALSLSETEEGTMDKQHSEEKLPGDEDLQEQTPPEEPTVLEKQAVQEALGKTRLPAASQVRLSEQEYQTEDELTGAIAAEVEYVKELRGDGKPFAQGSTSVPKQTPEQVKQAQDEGFNRIMREHGLEV